jgi:peptidoglycan/LPS O-acetylase OafA/YrhL
MHQPPPPAPGQVVTDLPPPPVSGRRRYDLDGLRAVAMYLGVVLHAAIPFIPYWEEGDAGGSFLFGLFEYIHTWRMPLFFLLSGYFTSMLWRRRSLRALVRHRLRRVGLPLLIGVFTILPLLIAGYIGGAVISGLSEDELNGIGAADEYEDPNDKAEVAKEKSKPEEGEQPFGFAHLWFLWHLLWMVAGFAAVAFAIDGLTRLTGREPPDAVGLLIGWLLLPLSWLFYVAFVEPIIGPDTSDSFIPAFNVLGFYACFFAFGALRYRILTEDRTEPIDRLGRAWLVQLPVSVVVFALLVREDVPVGWTDFAEVAMAWMVSFGAIGLFRTYASKPSFRARWFSDGAYWMYLIHLPLIFVLQGVALRLGLPAIVGFLFILAAITPMLVWSYRYLIRYRVVGTLLNGSRTREADAVLRQHLQA